jgi:hypothetical protein
MRRWAAIPAIVATVLLTCGTAVASWQSAGSGAAYAGGTWLAP